MTDLLDEYDAAMAAGDFPRALAAAVLAGERLADTEADIAPWIERALRARRAMDNGA